MKKLVTLFAILTIALVSCNSGEPKEVATDSTVVKVDTCIAKPDTCIKKDTCKKVETAVVKK